MSKQDQTALLTVIEAVLDDYFGDLPIALSAAASKELARTMAYLAKRKQALLSPAPKQPRKPKAQAAPAVAEHMATGSSEPIATFTPDKFYGSRRGRNGKSE